MVHDDPVTAIFVEYQTNWRNCHKCQAMYFAGHSGNGACPAPYTEETGWGHYGGERPDSTFPKGTFDFYLPTKNVFTGGVENGWRACWACLALVYDGPDKKSCAANDGGVHDCHGDEAGVYNFVLLKV
ncbi:hypothetical protein AB0D29_29030 [Streptomyces sp. NPDC048424]|uniref:hypothetical protein n=1 Tax=Streptomyces sp. NPDC048424 TaxID=3155265 RepID=UPI00342D8B49